MSDQKYLVPFDSLKTDITLLVAPVSDIKVTDFPSGQAAIDAGKQVKELQKRIDATRKSLVEPLNKTVKAINDYAKNIAEPLAKAEAYIKAELAAFDRQQEKIREAARQKLEAERIAKEKELLARVEAEKADAEAAAAMFGGDSNVAHIERKAEETLAIHRGEVMAKQFDINQMGIKNARKTWKCEAIDLALVPKEFLTITLNEKAVLAMARAGVTEIPGVKLWQDTTIAIGTNTYVPTLALKSGR